MDREAEGRGYQFNRSKILDLDQVCKPFSRIPVKSGQIQYEARYLLGKLIQREDRERADLLRDGLERNRFLLVDSVFRRVSGRGVEGWEVPKLRGWDQIA